MSVRRRRVRRLERALHRDEVDVLEDHDRRRQRGGQVDRGRHRAEALAGEQRCWVHKSANVLDAMPKRLQPRAKTLLHEIAEAPTQA
ncbi:MAG: hypothetical protein LC790_08980, partial [Actinobacteria bacterium]|nr:hypothetical protein [Actinomycetota bacterium]